MGTSALSILLTISFKDHPHAYGDKSSSMSLEKATDGSSPRVWGQENCQMYIKAVFGIIPTRMGTRKLYELTSFGYKDHPHAYGDKS